jgi:sugar phosphate permease
MWPPPVMLIWGWGVLVSCTGFSHRPFRIPSRYKYMERVGKRQGVVPVQVRGGAIDSKTLRRLELDDKEEDNSTAKHVVSAQEIRRRRGMGAALAATYFTVMASKCALPAVLGQLTSPEIGLKFSSTVAHQPQILMARLLTLSTIAIAAGKVFLGPVIDHFGGVLSLQVALSLLALLLTAISVSNSFRVFSVSWIIVDFIFSSCWAACINAIHQNFPRDEWAKRIGMLAAAARTGNAAAFALFASLLAVVSERGMTQSWRAVFAASALIQGVPVALLSYFGGMDNDDEQSTDANPAKDQQQQYNVTSLTEEPAPSPLKTLRKESKTPLFWLHLVSRSALMVFASFLLFVPLLMSEAYGSNASTAAQVGSLYALGCLFSVSFGSNLYARIRSKRQQALVIAILLGLATAASAAQLGHMAGAWKLSLEASAATLFLWGFSFAIPFYIPPSLYALSRGGVQSSATIADVFDIGGFALLAVFNGYVAGIPHAKVAAWIPTFVLTTSCSAIAMVCLVLATLLE